MLCFNTEQESGGESVNGPDTWDECSVFLLAAPGQMILLKVPVDHADNEVDEGEEEPADEEGGDKGQQSPPPLHIYGCREYILPKRRKRSRSI